MNSYAERLHHATDQGCGMCKLEIEDLGPLLGPDPLPHPSVQRWSMSPEEWAGQTMPDYEPIWR